MADGEIFGPMPPMKTSQVPAWGMGMALGENIANGLMESDDEMREAAEELGVEKFMAIFQSLGVEVTRGMAKMEDALADEDEENQVKGYVGN